MLGLPHATGLVNLIAVAIVMVITTILVIGIKESANFNSAVVIIKVADRRSLPGRRRMVSLQAS